MVYVPYIVQSNVLQVGGRIHRRNDAGGASDCPPFPPMLNRPAAPVEVRVLSWAPAIRSGHRQRADSARLSMNPLIPAVLIVSAILGLGVVAAEAGPCTKQIAAFYQPV